MAIKLRRLQQCWANGHLWMLMLELACILLPNMNSFHFYVL